jgi:helicase
LDEDALSFHICAEIKNKVITNNESLMSWYDRTLASIQQRLTQEKIDSVISKLEAWDCVKVDHNGFFKCTTLGLVAATLYYHPKDVYHWSESFAQIERQNLWDSDLALAYALAAPSMQLPYITRADQPRVSDLMGRLNHKWRGPTRASTLFADLFDLLSGEKPSMAARQFQNDADRICAALSWIGGIKAIARSDMWAVLPLRLKYGVPQKLVYLCQLPKIGAVRANKLYVMGIRSLEDVLNNPAKVQQVVGQNLVRDVMLAAKRLIRASQSDEN